MSETTSSFQQMAFPPEVLARIAPEISLQRHLAVNLRPSLRGFAEFRPLEVAAGGLSDAGRSNLVGSAIAKSGDTRVIVGITLGVVQENAVDELLADETSASRAAFTSVYPVVEIARGRSGAPTDEEMIISQKLYDTILHSKLIPKSALSINVGTLLDGQFEVLPEESSRWSYVLYAHIKVFSRSGPLFDICHSALIAALKNTKLPRALIDDNSSDIKIPVRGRNFGHIKQSKNLIVDSENATCLKLIATGFASSFGVMTKEVDDSTILLADLEGEAEESCAASKITIVTKEDNISHLSIVGGGAPITRELLKEAISIAKTRSQITNP